MMYLYSTSLCLLHLSLSLIFSQDVGIVQMVQYLEYDEYPTKDTLLKPLSFASYYGNNMVLQRAPYHAVIWGYSPNIGEKLNIKMSETEKIYKAVVELGPDGVNGVWKVKLNPETRTGPFFINVFSSNSVISLNNVLFGDVWLCSGQSNMVFQVRKTFNASQLIAEASNYPNIRLFKAAKKSSTTPQYDLLGIEHPWSMASEESVGKNTNFSAVCWLFGKSVFDKKKYPIGLVDTAWSGTHLEFWSSGEALKSCGLPDEECIMGNTQYGLDGLLGYSQLWNAMVNPLVNMTIYGVLWYQGEQNRFFHMDLYNCTFPAMIDDWRAKFSQAGETNLLFPFGFVQLAPRGLDPTVSTGFPDIRWHQTADYGYVPNTRMTNVFMSVAMDLPDFFSTYGWIHPRDKQDVVNRLVLSGLAVAYNESVEEWQGPLPTEVAVTSSGITLTYAAEITTRSPEGFEICCSADGGHECIPSKSWWLNSPIISTSQSSVTLNTICTEGENVLGIRYAWRESPCQFKKCAVYSTKAELPAPPFNWYKPNIPDLDYTDQIYRIYWDEPQPFNV